jgi:hypothetical protein
MPLHEASAAKECSIDWASAQLPAPFLMALARAQGKVQTVGKAGFNRDREYNYATSDSLLAELRRAFSSEGIYFLHSWRQVAPPDMSIGEKQWLTATIVIDWALLYGDVEGNVGTLRGAVECDAIGSAGRTPDKAMVAAKTFAVGFLAIGIGALDRSELPQDEDVDQRDDKDAKSPRAQRSSERPTSRQPAHPAGDPRVAWTDAEKIRELRGAIAKLFSQAKGRWKNMRELCGAAGVDTAKLDMLDAEHLRRVHEYAKAAVDGMDVEVPHDPRTGEVRP